MHPLFPAFQALHLRRRALLSRWPPSASAAMLPSITQGDGWDAWEREAVGRETGERRECGRRSREAGCQRRNITLDVMQACYTCEHTLSAFLFFSFHCGSTFTPQHNATPPFWGSLPPLSPSLTLSLPASLSLALILALVLTGMMR